MFNKNSNQFIWGLTAFNILFIGFYFSGIVSLQQLIAPTIPLDNFRYQQMREFGVVEMFQNVLLILICFFLIRDAIRRTDLLERGFFMFGSAAFVFLMLEELDYGLHFLKLFSGQLGDVTFFSWHNQWSDGLENATRVKRVIDSINALWFVLIPVLFTAPRLQNLKKKIAIVPSLWFAAGFILAFIFSRFAHYFDTAGYDIINGHKGNLHGTIAEFRETSLYYLYFLYTLQLIKTVSPIPFYESHAESKKPSLDSL